MADYGSELVLDIHGGNPETFTRDSIREYLKELCKRIDMEAEDLHFWDYEDDPEGYAEAPIHLKGISAVQFIKTSTIVLHTLTEMKRVYVNIFSCKDFDGPKTKIFTLKWFGGRAVQTKRFSRK